jgi:FkbH-like protein
LNIGFDSMVFLDDNPFERELIKKEIPSVIVPDLPDDPSRYLDFLQNLNLFETASYSEEDTERTRQYQEEAKRTVFRQSHTSEEDYLSSLGMTSEVKSFDKFSTPRIAQLTQRSNQFNLRTVRYTEQDITNIISAPDYLTFSFDLKDRFGDHGLIAALILKLQQDALFIDTWVMSCRVLKRGMEQFIINEIVKGAQSRNIKTIIGEFLPTPKNVIVKDLYSSLNFYNNNNLWVLNITNYTPFKTYINATN